MHYSISTKRYNRNRNGNKTPQQWREEEGNIETLIGHIKKEYAFCHCFNHQNDIFKTKDTRTQKNLKSADFVVFDLDAVKYTAGEFYGKTIGTEYTPTLIYTTCNDGVLKDGKQFCNRYRVIYELDEPITDACTYEQIVTGLKNDVAAFVGDDNLLNDNSDKDVSHFYAGNADADVFYNANVMRLASLIDKYVCSGSHSSQVPSVDKQAQKLHNGRHNKKGRGEYYSTVMSQMSHPYRDFVTDFFKTDKRFITLQRDYYRDIPLLEEHTPVKFEKGKLYKKVDDDYVSVYHKRSKVTKKAVSGNEITVWEYYKFKDGEHRRKKMYEYLQQIKQAHPYATREQLLWQAVNWVVEHVDNTIDPISRKDLVNTVENVMERQWCPSKKSKEKYGRKLAISTEEAKKQNIDMQRVGLVALNQARKDDKNKLYVEISFMYDPKLTDKENAEIMRDAGIEASVRQIREWKKTNGMTNKKKEARKKLIREKYDSSKTLKWNAEALNIPLSTLKKLKTEIENEYKQPEPVPYEIPDEQGTVLCESDRRIENFTAGMLPESVYVKSGYNVRKTNKNAHKGLKSILL